VCFGSLVVTPSARLDNRITHMSHACAVIYHPMFFIILLLSHLTASVIPLTIRSADGRVPYAFCKNGVRLVAFDQETSSWRKVFGKNVLYNHSMYRNSLSSIGPTQLLVFLKWPPLIPNKSRDIPFHTLHHCM